jgi:hypothetical protein
MNHDPNTFTDSFLKGFNAIILGVLEKDDTIEATHIASGLKYKVKWCR